MKKMLAFFKGEMVLTIDLIAALLSMLLIAPDAGYAAYVDWNVLMLLFALMAVVAGLKKCGVMDRVSQALLSRAGDARKLCLALSMACFFSAMLLPNDVALLTFVLSVLNLTKIISYRLQLRVYNSFYLILALFCVVMMAIDHGNMQVYLPMLNYCLAIQIAQAFTIHTAMSRRWILLTVLLALCAAGHAVYLYV